MARRRGVKGLAGSFLLVPVVVCWVLLLLSHFGVSDVFDLIYDKTGSRTIVVGLAVIPFFSLLLGLGALRDRENRALGWLSSTGGLILLLAVLAAIVSGV